MAKTPRAPESGDPQLDRLRAAAGMVDETQRGRLAHPIRHALREMYAIPKIITVLMLAVVIYVVLTAVL